MKALICACGLVLATSAAAEVTDSQASGFTIHQKLSIAAPPDRVWAALIHIQAWWDPAHTYSSDSANLSLEARPGGAFSEALPGGGVRHMTVVFVAPGRLLRLQGGLGPLQALGVSGSLTWSLKAEGPGTALTEVYDVGGHAPGGLDKLAGPVDEVLTGQMARLKAYSEGQTASAPR